MKNLLTNLRYKMNRFMEGRYGTDELNMFLLKVAIVVMLLSYLPKMSWLMLIAYGLIIWSLVRSLSRKYHKHRVELYTYIRLKNAVKGRISLAKQIWQNRKTHKYFTCKKCGNVFRVPKGKGKIEVTCPKCKDKSIRKS